jgi:hypothetical protein
LPGRIEWIRPGPNSIKKRIAAEAVEKANPLDHFIPDFCLHQSIQKHA